MGLPAQTIDIAWRNDAKAVADFLNTYHEYCLSHLNFPPQTFVGAIITSIILLESHMITADFIIVWWSVDGLIIALPVSNYSTGL
jgi:hypothetical protein